MSTLTKTVGAAYIPGDPGDPGRPAILAQPGHYITEIYYIRELKWVYYGRDESASLGAIDDTVIDSVWVWVPHTRLVWVPGVAASPAIPYRAPTPSAIAISLNQGWNSYARSSAALALGSAIEFQVATGTVAALMAIGYEGFEGQPINAFRNGILTDLGGIYVYESGVTVTRLASNVPGTTIRIDRGADGTITYSTSNGGAYTSLATRFPPSAPLYAYGILYSGYDQFICPAFVTTALVVGPTATMSGTFTLHAATIPSSRMSGVGTLTAAPVPESTMRGTGFLVGFANVGGRGSATFELLAAVGGDYEYGLGYGYLPALTGSGSGGFYVPPVPAMGYGYLPTLIGYATGIDNDIGQGSATFRALAAVGGDYAYGMGYGTMPMMTSYGYGGFVPDNALFLLSDVQAESNFVPVRNIVLILNSYGELESTLTLTKVQMLELLSEITAQSALSILGIYGLTLMSDLETMSLMALAVEGFADLDDTGVVWVMNRETGASAQYENYGFNSFFTREPDYFGVANDGIYKLSAATDAGNPINAVVETGRSNLGYTNQKTVHNIYLGIGSDNTLYLKVDVDGNNFVYPMATNGMDLRNRTVKIGNKVRGDFWDFTLINPEGADFNMASITFLPVPLPRRI